LEKPGWILKSWPKKRYLKRILRGKRFLGHNSQSLGFGGLFNIYNLGFKKFTPLFWGKTPGNLVLGGLKTPPGGKYLGQKYFLGGKNFFTILISGRTPFYKRGGKKGGGYLPPADKNRPPLFTRGEKHHYI